MVFSGNEVKYVVLRGEDVELEATPKKAGKARKKGRKKVGGPKRKRKK